MIIKTAIAGALTALSLIAQTGEAQAGALAPHEKTVTAPNGMSVTVGHTDNAIRPVPPLNGMPTSREAYLDNTSYGTVTGGTGNLHTGWFIACAVDLDVKFDIKASAGIDVNASVGASASLTEVTPTASVSISPELGASIGANLSITPGKIIDLTLPPALTDKDLPASGTGYIINRDYRLTVQNCGGPLTVQAYTVIQATSPEASVTEYVLGDPMSL
ncbi:MspA family porin [Nocardia sp. NPDC056000]|uniref:MspA family porin n=1 Tax=Nocardia sp. NPDC056000 TaxID=3345674 RepID=UPI0035E05C19